MFNRRGFLATSLALGSSGTSLRGAVASHHNVLSYLRRAADGTAVLVALNLSAKPQTVSFNLESHGLHGRHASTLLSSYEKAGQSADVNNMVLPAFGSWVGQIQ